MLNVICTRLDRLVGLVVRRPPRERKVPGSNRACAGSFSGSSHTSDLNIGTPVASLPGAWRYRVSTGTGRPGVSILWLGEMESLVCSFYLSVAARKIVCADPSLRYTRMFAGTLSNQQIAHDCALTTWDSSLRSEEIVKHLLTAPHSTIIIITPVYVAKTDDNGTTRS